MVFKKYINNHVHRLIMDILRWEREGGGRKREEERDVLFRHGSFISKNWFTLRKRRVEKILYIYQQFRTYF